MHWNVNTGLPCREPWVSSRGRSPPPARRRPAAWPAIDLEEKGLARTLDKGLGLLGHLGESLVSSLS